MFFTDEKLLCPTDVDGRVAFRVAAMNANIPWFVAFVNTKNSPPGSPKLFIATDVLGLAEVCDNSPIVRILGLLHDESESSSSASPMEIKQILWAVPKRKASARVFKFLLANGKTIYYGVKKFGEKPEDLKFSDFLSVS